MAVLTIANFGQEQMSYRSNNFPYGLWYFVANVGTGSTYTNWHAKTATYSGVWAYDHFENSMWFRCQLNVPQGTVLENVSFKVYGYTNNMNCTQQLSYRWYAVATDNCAAPTLNTYPTANDGTRYNAQTLTDSYVYWEPTRPALYMLNEEIVLPDFAPLINEILARPGWVSGNYVGITAKIYGVNETDNFYTPYTQLVGVKGLGSANPPTASYDELVPPDAPVASAQGGILENTISWNPVAGATSYNIYWDYSSPVTTEAGFYHEKITGVTSPYDHTGLAAGIPIYYIVTALAGSDPYFAESDPSNEVSATPHNSSNTFGRIIW